MANPLIQGDAILTYIPQQPPFVMVDTLYEIDEKSVLSGFTVLPENVLVSGGEFQEGGMVENMAQTVALFAGFLAKKHGVPVPIGYIAAIRDLQIGKLPKVGEALFTKVEIVNEVFNMQIAMAELRNKEEEVLGSCELRIFIKGEDADQ